MTLIGNSNAKSWAFLVFPHRLPGKNLTAHAFLSSVKGFMLDSLAIEQIENIEEQIIDLCPRRTIPEAAGANRQARSTVISLTNRIMQAKIEMVDGIPVPTEGLRDPFRGRCPRSKERQRKGEIGTHARNYPKR